MSGFIDTKVRVETNKLGKLVEDLAQHIPYAQIIGHTIAIPRSSPDKRLIAGVPKSTYYRKKAIVDGPFKHRLSTQQKLVLEAIKQGGKTLITIRKMAGLSLPANTTRVINNLLKFGYITGKEGTYTSTPDTKE